MRFNFIAVDYLVYTNEVLGNIEELYNMPVIISAIVAAVILILFFERKKLILSQLRGMYFGKRTIYFMLFLLFPLEVIF